MTKEEFASLPKKISLLKYPCIRYMIREMRKEKINSYTAEELSVEIGKSKSWLAQIENGRLNSIAKQDLILIVTKLSGETSIFDSIDEEVAWAIQYYKEEYERKLQDAIYEEEGKLPLTEDTLIKRDIVKVIFNIKNSIFNDINNLTIDEKKKLLNSLETLNKNINSNISLTCILLSLPIHAINNYNSDNTKNFVADINLAFTNYLSTTLNNSL